MYIVELGKQKILAIINSQLDNPQIIKLKDNFAFDVIDKKDFLQNIQNIKFQNITDKFVYRIRLSDIDIFLLPIKFTDYTKNKTEYIIYYKIEIKDGISNYDEFEIKELTIFSKDKSQIKKLITNLRIIESGNEINYQSLEDEIIVIEDEDIYNKIKITLRFLRKSSIVYEEITEIHNIKDILGYFDKIHKKEFKSAKLEFKNLEFGSFSIRAFIIYSFANEEIPNKLIQNRKINKFQDIHNYYYILKYYLLQAGKYDDNISETILSNYKQNKFKSIENKYFYSSSNLGDYIQITL